MGWEVEHGVSLGGGNLGLGGGRRWWPWWLWGGWMKVGREVSS